MHVFDTHSNLCGLEGDVLNCRSTYFWRKEMERGIGEGGVGERLGFSLILGIYCLNFLNGLVVCLKVKRNVLLKKKTKLEYFIFG